MNICTLGIEVELSPQSSYTGFTFFKCLFKSALDIFQHLCKSSEKDYSESSKGIYVKAYGFPE